MSSFIWVKTYHNREEARHLPAFLYVININEPEKANHHQCTSFLVQCHHYITNRIKLMKECHHYITNMDKTDETEQSKSLPVYVLFNVIITSKIWLILMKLDRATITSVRLVQCHHHIKNMD